MITRSRRDSNYEFLELPNKKRCKKQVIDLQPPSQPSENVSVQPSMQVQSSAPTRHTIDYIESETSIHSTPYRPLYEVNIDFDEAHREWVKNKIKMPNGCYKYRKERSIKTRNTKRM